MVYSVVSVLKRKDVKNVFKRTYKSMELNIHLSAKSFIKNKKYKEAEESLRNCMVSQLAFLDFDDEDFISTIEMLAIATVALNMIEDTRVLLDSSLEYREKNGVQITSIHESQPSCLGTVYMTSVALLKLYISNGQLELGHSFLQTLSRFVSAQNVSDKDLLMEKIGPARKLASFFLSLMILQPLKAYCHLGCRNQNLYWILHIP